MELRIATAATPEFVVLSSFVMANGMESEVKAAFRARPHVVDNAPGCLRMEMISPVEIGLLTLWTDEAGFRTWHHGHLYHESHRGIPKGLKRVAGETKISCFKNFSVALADHLLEGDKS